MLQVILIFIYYFWEGRHEIQFLLLYWRHAFTKNTKDKKLFFCSFKDKRIGKPLVLSKNHLTHYLQWMELSYIYPRVSNEKQALMKDKRQRKAILMSITLQFLWNGCFASIYLPNALYIHVLIKFISNF